jgi:hypothetical protein
MDNNEEPVWIMFITDTETRDKLLKYGSGSQWQVIPRPPRRWFWSGRP